MHDAHLAKERSAALPPAQQPMMDLDALFWTQTCAWAHIASLTRKLAVGSDAALRDQLREAIARLVNAHCELARLGQPQALMHCAVFMPGRIEFAYYALSPDARVTLCVEGTHDRVYRFDVCSPALHETLAPLLPKAHDTSEVPR
ncbi:MAG: hypothetical protein VB131_01935 [Burkholderia gladioli]